MEIFIKGKGKEILNKHHYVSSGGEGSVYAKKLTAYKIYNNISRMIPEKKIKELSVLNHSSIIKPQSIILDKNNKHIGYTMKYIKNTVAICQLFTKAFKDRNNIKLKDVMFLINQLRKAIKYCHDNNILIVDINELNFLINSDKFNTIYCIDVDSYQTKSYSATAIMDSIRDRQAKKWTTNSDWFSFAIISFQMLIGIHPFKGKHAIHKTLDDRMRNNISVFNSKVKIPPTALSIDIIPQTYRDWYLYVFEKGKRTIPPIDFDVHPITITPKIKTIKDTNNFIIKIIKEYNKDIILFYDNDTVLTIGGLYYSKNFDDKIAPYAQIIKSPRMNYIITAIVKNNKLKIYNVTKKADLSKINGIELSAEKVMSFNNRLYIKQEDKIS